MPLGPLDRGILVLISLADGPKHGYALMKDVEAFAGERLGPGSLYGALTRLDDEGLITALPWEARRRPYRITEAGRVALEAELLQRATIARVGLRRLSARSN